jgi:RHS repeat-associated protein
VGKSGSGATDTIYFSGRPVARLAAGAWTDLVYGGGGLLAEVTSSGPVYRMTNNGPAATAAQTAGLPCSSLGLADNGNILQILDSLNGNNSQAFSYDNLNRIASFTNGNGTMQQCYTIDPWGNMSITCGNLQTNLFFGTNNQISSNGYGYDASGNLTSFNNGISTVGYTYDAEGKMLTANSGLATYTYDAEGNRARKDSGGTWTEYIHFNDQPLAEKNADGTWSDYIYANGQRMARADSFDIRIHMIGTNCSNCGTNPNMFAGTTSLTAANGYLVRAGDLLTWRQYQDGSALGGLFFGLLNSSGNYVDGTSLQDSDNQPILADATKGSWHVRTVDLSSFAGMKIDFIDPFDSTNAPAGAWDIYYGDITLVSTDGTFVPIYSRSMMNLSPATAPDVSGFSVITEKVADTTPLTTTYDHADQIGSTRLLTAGTGWPVASDTYNPYGQGPTPGVNHYLFTGKERDTESGLDYFGARYYGSSMGRWMSPDPGKISAAHLANPQKWNKYNYVLNNPLSMFDPDGQQEMTIVYRTFIPTATATAGGKTYAGDNRTFSLAPVASSRSTITVLIETDPSIRPGNPIISTTGTVTGSAGQTTELSPNGNTSATATTGLPFATGSRDANGNAVINITQDVKNPLSPADAYFGTTVGQAITPGISANLTMSFTPNGAGITTTGTASNFPSEELNVTNSSGTTTPIFQFSPPPGSSPFSLYLPDRNVSCTGTCPK